MSFTCLYPKISFVGKQHSSAMMMECQLYLNQMKKWLKGYGNEWLRGAITVQAVTNTLPCNDVMHTFDEVAL